MRPAAVAEQESVEVVVTLPVELLRELEEYAGRDGASVAWALRRGARLLLDEEAAQDKRLSTLSAGKRQPGRIIVTRK